MKKIRVLMLLVSSAAFAQALPGPNNQRISRHGGGPGGSSPQVQFNNGGKFGGTTQVISPDGLHIDFLTEPTTPPAPGTGVLLYSYASDGGAAAQVNMVDSAIGDPQPIWFDNGTAGQAFMASTVTKFCRYYTLGDHNQTTLLSVGGTTNLGTCSGSQTAVNWDAGDWVGRQISVKSTVSSVNGSAGFHDPSMLVWRGNGAGQGGFWVKSRQCLNGFSGTRIFIGLQQAGTVIAAGCVPFTVTAETSSCLGCAYIGADGTDTNLSACSNDTAGTATCTTLGSNFPKTSGCYDVTLSGAVNGSVIQWSVDRLDTSVPSQTGVFASDLPVPYFPMGWVGITENTDGGTAVAFQMMGVAECTGL